MVRPTSELAIKSQASLCNEGGNLYSGPARSKPITLLSVLFIANSATSKESLFCLIAHKMVLNSPPKSFSPALTPRDTAFTTSCGERFSCKCCKGAYLNSP